MIAKGIGFPLVLIPGLQGRWEWMTPTVEALQAGHRVITFSLQELRPEREKHGLFQAWTRALDLLIDRTLERKVSLVGISFGGLIAARYAAHRPERVTSLVIASSPAPNWRPRPDDEICLKMPRLSMPYFGARGFFRLLPEVMKARENWPLRGQFLAEHTRRVFDAPIEPVRMAQWMREFLVYDLASDCKKIKAPTLVITGESKLDRVVPVRETKRFLSLIKGSTHQVLPNTGHLGCITKPYRFAEMTGQFIYAAESAARAAKSAEDRIRARSAG